MTPCTNLFIAACILSFSIVGCNLVRRLNIALHAQLYPTNDKVVGSVITTNGLKRAFMDRPDVTVVEIFYPAHYSAYLNQTWDLVLIEGWFPSIDQFLVLTRNNFPKTRIVFISLDPAYPGKEIVHNFDVDGILTNSLPLVPYYIDKFPTDYMLLAADPTIMRPYPNISRTYGAIYIGAGGNMLDYKPELYQLLVDAVPYGLRLHGNAWEGVPILEDVAQGGLPQYELARAYASAHVVLGSTMDAQSQYRMINNRIFEALACGALVVTKDAQELRYLQCDALLLTNQTHTLHTYMAHLQSMTKEEVEKLRQSGRDWVLSRHTWAHRAVQIVDFYQNLLTGVTTSGTRRFAYSEICGSVTCLRPNCPKLLWLVSPHLQQHQDYLQVLRTMGRLHLCELFTITEMPSSTVTQRSSLAEIREYDYILSFVTPFDPLDRAMRTLEVVSKPAAFGESPILQKRAGYLLGFDANLIDDYLTEQAGLWPENQVALSFDHYDTVWYRSELELALLAQVCGARGVAPAGRLQLMFGVGAVAEGEEVVSVSGNAVVNDEAATVVICVYPHIHLCARSNRNYFVRSLLTEEKTKADEVNAYTLLLLGGTWDEWLSAGPGHDGQPFLRADELHTVVHVRSDRIGDAVRVVQGARAVVILNPSYGDTARYQNMQLCLSRAHALRAADITNALRRCLQDNHVRTTEEVIWPLIAAAVASARIHLLSHSPQVLDVAQSGCGEWSQERFVVMVQTGLNRLLGLGSTHTTVSARRLRLQEYKSSSGAVTLTCGSECSTRDLSMVGTFMSSHKASFAGGLDEPQTEMAFVTLEHENFQVGRDGECCIQQKLPVKHEETDAETEDGEQVPGDKVCLMRPYKYLVVQLKAPRNPNNRHLCRQDSAGLELTVQLRGSFFGDPFYAVNLTVNAFDGFLPGAPRVFNSSWLATHGVFVYDASYC